MHERDPGPTFAAQSWVGRLTSGDMNDREMRRFRDWVAKPDNERAFQLAVANWRTLGALREGLARTITLPSASSVMRRKLTRWVSFMIPSLNRNG
jgi:ferric-dicitrate binding protein FerR (iron transport regulator)